MAESLQIELKFQEKEVERKWKLFDYEIGKIVDKDQLPEEKCKIDFFLPNR